jgi:hypothetical protein
MADLHIATTWFLLPFFLDCLANILVTSPLPLRLPFLLRDNPDSFGNGICLPLGLQLFLFFCLSMHGQPLKVVDCIVL